MKKFYFLIFTSVLILTSFASQAQVTYASITDGNPNNWTLDDGRFWQGGTPPPNPCTDCTIIINSNVTVVPNDGTTTATYVPPSVPALNDVVLNGCTLKVNGNITLTINTYLELFDTQIIIGSDISTAAKVLLNDQVDLNGTSSVRLGNINCSIDVRNLGTAANGFTPNPINGPNTDFDALSKSAGIFGILTAPDGGGYLYSYVLVSNYIGTYNHKLGDLYTLNCDDGGPNDCATGVIFGPALTSPNGVFGVTFQQSTTLPVQLVQFLATKNADASIKLSWATAQEINSSSFEIERSADQGNWQNIGSVKAKGYSSSTANYTYTDQFPLAGNNYYRLKMVDLDGKFKYSKVVAVTSAQDGRPLVIYSNPFSDQIRMKVNVNKAQNLSLTVTDIIGKTYLKQSYNAQAGDNLINLVPAGAARGMYILHIQGNTYEQTVKLAKQ